MFFTKPATSDTIAIPFPARAYPEVTVTGANDAVAIPLPTQAYAEAPVPRCEATVAYAEVAVSGANNTVATFLCT